MEIAVIDYKGGNVQSVLFALERLGVQATLTSDPEVIQRADKVLFPGEGEAASAMRELRAQGLDQLLPSLTQPFLGICLGMQLLGQHSEEGGGTDLLGILPFNVIRFPTATEYKVPHMGWNTLQALRTPLFAGLREEDYVYFVHSYFAPVGEYTIAQAEYPAPFSAAVQHQNFYAVQFHTEKSGPVGTRILENFLKL
ncbi:imidazole glycerol phosphate synthase subunit HisH [Hymenobacter sp. 5516J-16]|uniref:Imidazole glycerol phosphate synthase subunit HisH n=1 Tax=Hymenobacter sublimis TaxID=2933777 RepID=A0ABY4JDL5_9BACT|nr:MULTISPECIES: imidazole glycerol phosphate synthase subunit HisH [Hymenobacter]UOQ77242.1 imidazole glycerol phosphate synthase subunit HisH [Hymenobacter sp. 5516J-16]UPL50920.1 imidazole glycerol phosphate synthase subunit HisH [Hymenobacter sublimis]